MITRGRPSRICIRLFLPAATSIIGACGDAPEGGSDAAVTADASSASRDGSIAVDAGTGGDPVVVSEAGALTDATVSLDATVSPDATPDAATSEDAAAGADGGDADASSDAGGGCPLDCSALSDACNVGACDPSTGGCHKTVRANGTPCDDGSACTNNDQCKDGTCIGVSAVVCLAADACHAVGTCDRVTGACSQPPKPTGTPCSTGNACIIGESCTGGVCGGGTARACDDGNACTVDACDPVTGCSNVDRSACGVVGTTTSACTINRAGGCTAVDTDGDGFSDAWEENGYIDYNCNGRLDAGDFVFPNRSQHVFSDVVRTGTGSGQMFPTVTDPTLPIGASSATVVTVFTTGGLGTAKFTVSVDGGPSSSPRPILPVVDMAANLRLLFYNSNFVAGDTHTFSTSMAPSVKVADRDRPNVYVQWDYMDFDVPTGTTCATDDECFGGGVTPNLVCHGGFCTHNHFPGDPLYRKVVKAFDDNGITLYIDPVHHAVPHANVVTFAQFGDPDNGWLATCAGADLAPGDVTNGKAVSFFDYKNRTSFGGPFDPRRRPVFRYSVLGHFATCLTDATGEPGDCGSCPWDRATPLGRPTSGIAGTAELPGNDFIVSLGARHYTSSIARTPFDEQGVFMHELGHTLGLHHGGDNANYENAPNYLSVMNNKYVFTGIQHAAAPGSTLALESLREVSYSSHTLNTIFEPHLDEALGTSSLASGFTGIVRFFNFAGGSAVGPESGSINWDGLPAVVCTTPADCAGGASLTGTCLPSGSCEVQADLNGFSGISEQMVGYRDWSHTAGATGSGGGACVTSADCRVNAVRSIIKANVDPTADDHEECVLGVCRPFIFQFQCYQWGVADAGAPLAVRMTQEQTPALAALTHDLYPLLNATITVLPVSSRYWVIPGAPDALTVVIGGTTELDAQQVDRSTVHVDGVEGSGFVLTDFDGDGRPDLIASFPRARTRERFERRPHGAPVRVTGSLNSSQGFTGLSGAEIDDQRPRHSDDPEGASERYLRIFQKGRVAPIGPDVRANVFLRGLGRE